MHSKGEATREALMEAAFVVFADKGFLRAQIGDIVRAAGKSNGVFHIYFKNKDALLDAWLDRCDDTVPWYWAETELLFEKAWPFVVNSYWSLYDRFGPILEALDAAALVSDHFAQRLAELRGKSDASIARMIRHGQGEGRFADVDSDLLAISIAAVLTDVTAYWFQNRTIMEARGLDQHLALEQLRHLSESMLEPGKSVATAAQRAARIRG